MDFLCAGRWLPPIDGIVHAAVYVRTCVLLSLSYSYSFLLMAIVASGGLDKIFSNNRKGLNSHLYVIITSALKSFLLVRLKVHL